MYMGVIFKRERVVQSHKSYGFVWLFLYKISIFSYMVSI